MPPVMNVGSTAQLNAFAANATFQNGLGVAVLGVALDQSSSSAEQMLQALSPKEAAQKDGSGQLVDVYA